MKKRILVLLGFILAGTNSLAAIIGNDDRTDIVELDQPIISVISSRVVSFVRKKHLIKKSDSYEMNATNLIERLRFCEDERFSDEPLFANCSGAIVGEDRILTAGHCIGPDNQDEFYVVLDYIKDAQGNIPTTFSKDQVFEVRDFLYREFTLSDQVNDIALLRVKRKLNRTPLPVQLDHSYSTGTPIYMLGHPLGVSQKYTGPNIIRSLSLPTLSFRTELDSFSVNSGSPVFDHHTNEIIGVLSRGTGANFNRRGRSCNQWALGESGKDYSEVNIVTPLKPLF
ncbi:MAG: hypothetical protein CME65_03060 [Halobacteriovoraceae bacterium]|nr:hypothetical protein [Halobacteriovoraceae bacterium]|tara:strand:+ start:5081 stop:5929 length:849 start_codon:yes stop_codon:yes gene_type:complete